MRLSTVIICDTQPLMLGSKLALKLTLLKQIGMLSTAVCIFVCVRACVYVLICHLSHSTGLKGRFSNWKKITPSTAYVMRIDTASVRVLNYVTKSTNKFV